MPTIAETVAAVVAAPSWDVRINALRQVPANHGTNDWQAIYAEIARQLYVPHLSPDFAYIHSTPAYSLPTFQVAYERLVSLTENFRVVDVDTLARAIESNPIVLLPLRVITGLTSGEFGVL